MLHKPTEHLKFQWYSLPVYMSLKSSILVSKQPPAPPPSLSMLDEAQIDLVPDILHNVYLFLFNSLDYNAYLQRSFSDVVRLVSILLPFSSQGFLKRAIAPFVLPCPSFPNLPRSFPIILPWSDCHEDRLSWIPRMQIPTEIFQFPLVLAAGLYSLKKIVYCPRFSDIIRPRTIQI